MMGHVYAPDLSTLKPLGRRKQLLVCRAELRTGWRYKDGAAGASGKMQREAATSHWALEGQQEDSRKQKKDLPGKRNILIKGRAETFVSGVQMGG